MYVVRRPFRTSKGVITAGSVVEPAAIKRFKRFKYEGRIIAINETNYDRYKEFFKVKFGVDLPALDGEKEPIQESLDIVVDTEDVPEETPEEVESEKSVESPVEGQQKLPLDEQETQTTTVKAKPKAQVKVTAAVK